MWNPFQSKTEAEDLITPDMTEKQQRLVRLILELKELLPPVAQSFLSANTLTTLSRQFDDEKIDLLLEKIKAVVFYVEQGGDSPITEDDFGLGAGGNIDPGPVES